MPESPASTPQPNGTGLTISDAADQIADLFSAAPGTTKKPQPPSAKPPVSESDPATAEGELDPDDEAEGTDEVDPEADDPEADDPDAESSEEEAEADAEGADNLDALHRFEHDGQQIEVTTRELIRGFRREDDYTRKTQAMAEKVKTAEAEVEGTRKERAVYTHLIGALRQHLEAAQPKEPNWAELKASDPIEYSIQLGEWQQRQAKIAALAKEETRVKEQERAEAEEKRQGILKEALAQQRTKLFEYLPHWKNPEKAASEGAQVRAYALKAGLSKEEVDSIAHTSALAIHLIRKAMLYDRAVDRTNGVRPQPQAAPRNTATPGASNRTMRNASEFKRASQRLAKSGTLKDASKAIELLI